MHLKITYVKIQFSPPRCTPITKIGHLVLLRETVCFITEIMCGVNAQPSDAKSGEYIHKHISLCFKAGMHNFSKNLGSTSKCYAP